MDRTTINNHQQQLTIDDDNRGLHLLSSEGCTKGDVLLAVPHCRVVTASKAKIRNEALENAGCGFIPRGWSSLSEALRRLTQGASATEAGGRRVWAVELAVGLLNEFRDKNSTSLPWIRTLPINDFFGARLAAGVGSNPSPFSTDLLLLAATDKLHLLRDSVLERQVKNEYIWLGRVYKEAIYFDEESFEVDADHSEEQQRCSFFNCQSAPLCKGQRLCPLHAREPLVSFGSFLWCYALARSRGMEVLSPSGKVVRFVIQGVDFSNHSSQFNSVLEVGEDGVKLCANQHISEGQEVTIDYGLRNFRDIFRTFGFLEKFNSDIEFAWGEAAIVVSLSDAGGELIVENVARGDDGKYIYRVNSSKVEDGGFGPAASEDGLNRSTQNILFCAMRNILKELEDSKEEDIDATGNCSPAEALAVEYSAFRLSIARRIMKEIVEVDRAKEVLATIDEFCYNVHWMMHIGPKKLPIIESAFLQGALAEPGRDPLVFVEFGTYTGYSSVVLSHLLKSHGREGVVYSIEIEESFAKIAREVVSISGCLGNVEVVVSHDVEDGMLEISKACGSQSNFVDFLFIDHDKDEYESDLKHVVKMGYLKPGCVVVADNVGVAGLEEGFVDYVKCSEAFTECNVESTEFEYDGDIKDAIMVATAA